LVTQTADILREELKYYQKALPCERFLADQFKVSRPTLRAALAVLRREGLIRVTPGQSSKIISQPHTATSRSSSKVVGILAVRPMHQWPTWEIYFVGELRRHLQQAGYQLEVHVDGRLRWKRPQSILKNLVRQYPACCWLLNSQGLPVQRWFADQLLPSILLGTCYAQVHLPSIDINFRAVTRHAVGLLLGMKHRRIALLIRQSNLAGDLESEKGFREAFCHANHLNTLPSVVCHNQTIEDIQNRLNSLMYSKTPPTGIIVSHCIDALTTLTCLTRMGFRIPGSISLISRDDDGFLANAVPKMTRYIFDWDDYTRKVFRMITCLTSTHRLPSSKVWIMPKVLKGETIAMRRQSS
jgi:LacI family transcriptional regulator